MKPLLDTVNAASALEKVPSQLSVLPASPFSGLGVEVNKAEGSIRPKRPKSDQVLYLSLEKTIYGILERGKKIKGQQSYVLKQSSFI